MLVRLVERMGEEGKLEDVTPLRPDKYSKVVYVINFSIS